MLNSKTRGSVAFPLTSQCFVVEALNDAQPGRPGKHRDVLPFLVALENLTWRRAKLLVDATMLLDAPHTTLCLCHIWYVKVRRGLRHNVYAHRRAQDDGRQSVGVARASERAVRLEGSAQRYASRRWRTAITSTRRSRSEIRYTTRHSP